MVEASSATAARTHGELCRLADECWAQDQSRAALEAAWAAFDLAPDERTMRFVTRVIGSPSERNARLRNDN